VRLIRVGLLLLGMCLAVALAIYYTPKHIYAAGQKPDISLEDLIPKEVDGWILDDTAPQQVINPSEQKHLAIYYSDNLSRVYVNKKGERLMLSLAYGADQSRAMQVHKPEVCYEAQGFKVVASKKGEVALKSKKVPVMRLVAVQGARVEPITYWIRTGNYVVRGWLEQNIARVRNSLITGYTPDGLLVRVSTLGEDRDGAYKLQDEFLNSLYASSSAQAKKMILGENY
jgi:EpsI family protein